MKCCEYGPWVLIHNTLLSLCHANGSNKQECLSLSSPSSLACKPWTSIAGTLAYWAPLSVRRRKKKFCRGETRPGGSRLRTRSRSESGITFGSSELIESMSCAGGWCLGEGEGAGGGGGGASAFGTGPDNSVSWTTASLGLDDSEDVSRMMTSSGTGWRTGNRMLCVGRSN